MNKKAFILTLDALLAVIIVLIVLGAANSYIARSENVMPNIQTARTGSDIVKLLETIGFQTLNWEEIEEEAEEIKVKEYVEGLLSASYGMRLNISWADAGLVESGSFEVGDELPNKKSISTGKRFFVVISDSSLTHYGLVKYWIWLK